MKAELVALRDVYDAVDLTDVHPEARIQAREQREELVAAIRARDDMVVSVAECARRLGIKEHYITGLVERDKVWHDKRRMWSEWTNRYRMSRIVREIEVRMKLAEMDVEKKASKRTPKKKEPLPAGWISISQFATLTATRRTTLTEWCKMGKMKAAKYVIPHGVGHASSEWCVPLDESVGYLRQAIITSRARTYGGNVIQPDPKVKRTPLIEDIWQWLQAKLLECY